MPMTDTNLEFHDGYRSVFRFNLERGETVEGVAQHYVREWLANRKDGAARIALDRWDGVEPVTLPGGSRIVVTSFEDERSGDYAVRYRITDKADAGEYRVTVSAVGDTLAKRSSISFVVTASTNAQLLRTLRNHVAHNRELTDRDGSRVHDYLAILLETLGDQEGAASAIAMRTEVEEELWNGSRPAASTSEEDLPVATPQGSDKIEEQASDLKQLPQDPELEPEPEPEDSFTLFSSVGVAEPLYGAAPQRSLFDGSEPATPLLGKKHLDYEPWTPLGKEDPELLDSPWRISSKERIRGVIEQIVEAEGPISMTRLVALTGREFGIQRLHADRGKILMKEAKASELTIDGDLFVWPDGVDPQTWTQFRPNAPDVDREFTEISPVEIRNAARAVREENPDLEQDAFERAVLDVFGRKRRTEAVREHLRKALALLD